MHTNGPFWPHIESIDYNGNKAIDMLSIVFFLEPESCQNPNPVVSAIRLYLDLFQFNCSYYFTDDEGDIQSLPSEPQEILEERIVKMTLGNDCVDFRLVDKSRIPYMQMVSYFFDLDELDNFNEGERVPLWFRLTQEALEYYGIEEVINFAKKLTKILPYSYGYMNPSLTCEESFLTALPYLGRYPGLDVSLPEAVATDIGDRLMGPFWINFLGANLSISLGGKEFLERQLPTEVEVESCGQDGLCVRLSKWPKIGDSNRKELLPNHHKLANILRKFMHDPEVTYFTDDSNWLDPEGQSKWHKRFIDT